MQDKLFNVDTDLRFDTPLTLNLDFAKKFVRLYARFSVGGIENNMFYACLNV